MELPERWKLVPIELTEEMNVAGICAAMQFQNATGLEALNEKRRTIYRAQLAAAPTPPAQEDEPVAYEIYDAIRKPCSWISVSKEKYLELTSIGWNGRTLYTRPADDKLRKAAEAMVQIIESSTILNTPLPEGFWSTYRNLRAALEGK